MHAEPQNESGGLPECNKVIVGFWVVITVGRAQTIPSMSNSSSFTAAQQTLNLRVECINSLNCILHHPSVCVSHPLIQALVIYAKAQWKSDCDCALRRAIDCNVDDTSSFKCLGPINTTKGLGRWIQTKAFFPLIYFYFSFLCRAIRDVWPINSSIHHASTHPPPSIHSALC